MKTNSTVDAARLSLLLNELRLPAIKVMWPQFAEQADKEGWPAARFLAALTEHELAERDRRRIERHLAEARLLPGKTLDTFAFDAVPMISKAQVMAITAGDSWLEKGANLLMVGYINLQGFQGFWNGLAGWPGIRGGAAQRFPALAEVPDVERISRLGIAATRPVSGGRGGGDGYAVVAHRLAAN